VQRAQLGEGRRSHAQQEPSQCGGIRIAGQAGQILKYWAVSSSKCNG
jgi:hypothetical protein